MCFHLFLPFNTKSNHFSYQTFLVQYAKQGNCFCLMFMYCGKQGSPTFSGGRDEVRLMIGAQREGPTKEKTTSNREIFTANNLWQGAEEKEF